MSVKPPTARMTFLDGMRLFVDSPIFLKYSEAYGSFTVGEDRHLSVVIPWDVPSLPGIWLWREWHDVCLYLVSLAVYVPVIWLKVI